MNPKLDELLDTEALLDNSVEKDLTTRVNARLSEFRRALDAGELTPVQAKAIWDKLRPFAVSVQQHLTTKEADIRQRMVELAAQIGAEERGADFTKKEEGNTFDHELPPISINDFQADGARLIERGEVQFGQSLAQFHVPDFTQAMVKGAEENYSALMRRFYPRRYEHVGNYHSPKVVAASFVQMVAELHHAGYEKLGTAMKLMLPAMDYLVERRMPMFFIAPALLEAVKRSDFQEDINWLDLRLPYEHGVIVLPRGGLVHPEDGDTVCIYWSRVRAGVSYTCKAARVDNPISYVDSNLSIVAFTSTGIFYDSNLTSAVRPTVRLRNLFYKLGAENTGAGPSNVSSPADSPLRDQDRSYIEDVGCIVFGTFLAMNARAGLVAPGQRLKVVKAKGDKPSIEYWTPNIIGRDYQAKRQGTGGGHMSPRMHWRRGHFRSQIYGPRSVELEKRERKVIWIEPMLVAAGSEQAERRG